MREQKRFPVILPLLSFDWLQKTVQANMLADMIFFSVNQVISQSNANLISMSLGISAYYITLFASVGIGSNERTICFESLMIFIKITQKSNLQ